MNRFTCAIGALVLSGVLVAAAQDPPPVPADLRPWLTTRGSEMNLVARRYALYRDLLHGNYAGAHRDADGLVVIGGPRGDDPPLSAARIARLERFDLAWQQALAAMDASRLSLDARRDLTALLATVMNNVGAADAEAARYDALVAVLPFAPALVDLIERRIRVEPVDSESSAATLARALGEIAEEPHYTIGPDVPLEDAFRFLEAEDAERVPVVDEHHRLIGVLSRSVLQRRLAEDEEPPGEDDEPPDLLPAA